MRTFLTWSDKIHDREGTKQPVYDVTFKPDGTQLLAAAGSQILVYNISDGELVQSLKGHKDTVYCVDFSADGSRFASGGADKTVIIWNQKLEAILKYTHGDPVQALSHNPVTGQVISCSTTDFGLWSPEQTNVTKHKTPSKILSCSWTPDGQHFAFGLYNGNVSIRNKQGDEKLRIERGTAPIWSVCWNPGPNKEFDVLAVMDWNQKVSFFNLSGRQMGKDRNLDFDPCSASYFSNGDYLVVGGSDRKVTLWTAEGTRLGMVCEREGWIWCCKVKPKQNYVAVGSHDGSISLYQIVFNTVHGLYHDRYAYRENMTDVVIQHLSTDQRARIKCRDYVKKIAVYRDRLAVQLPDRIIIYELFHDDDTDMHYRIKEKLQKKLDCNLLVVTAQHVILCMEKKLQMLNFTGEKEREWNVEALIRYIKVIGGEKCREGLLVGLKNGQILQIFIDNAFPIPLIKQTTSVRCLDMSLTRTKLAVVDEHNTCFVYNLRTRELLFQEPNANSVAWNSEFEDMLCYSGNGMLNIKAGEHPAHQQKLQGFVVGFKGSKIFCLHVYAMTAVDVPQSAALVRYTEKKDFAKAYTVACLGVTEGDWRKLALEALESLKLDVARKSFVRLRDLRYIDLVANIEKLRREGKNEPDMFLADIYAYEGKYQEAGKLYKKSGHIQKAIDMFTELNMWEYATKIAEETNANVEDILKKKARMQHDKNDLMAAATTYIEVGDYAQAIELLGQNGWMDKLIQVARSLNKVETKLLSRCAYYFRRGNDHGHAAETLVKMGNIAHLLNLHVELQHWDEAFKLAETHPEFNEQIYLPYANWLALNDRFIEAQLNFRKAGRLDEAFKVLERLTRNAVIEKRYNDASYYLWLSAMEHLKSLPAEKDVEQLNDSERKNLEAFHNYYEMSGLYHTYHHVFRYLEEPFTSHHPESLFNMARFLLHHSINKSLPFGISKVYVFYALVKQARNLGAYKLARYVYEKLAELHLPPALQDTVDLGSVTVRSKPVEDKEELLPVCYACGAINPLINVNGARCVQCQQEFVVSFHTFEALPLVEFRPAKGISEEEALQLIEADPPVLARRNSSPPASTKRNVGSRKTSKDDFDSIYIEEQNDRFDKQIETMEASTISSVGGSSYLELDRMALQALNKNDVYVRRWPCKAVPPTYYKNALPDVQVAYCDKCRYFFHQDDYEFLVLQKQECPFCRSSVASE